LLRSRLSSVLPARDRLERRALAADIVIEEHTARWRACTIAHRDRSAPRLAAARVTFVASGAVNVGCATKAAFGIVGARGQAVVDLASLVARDHAQLHVAIAQLVDPGASVEDRRAALESARVGLATHADGEAAILHEVLSHITGPRDFAGLIAEVLAAHRTQESILRRMDHRASREEWVCAAVRFRRSLTAHDEHERNVIMGALRRSLEPDQYERLAGAYASEKMRALGVLSGFVPRHSTRRDIA
jgi:hypothetical protein